VLYEGRQIYFGPVDSATEYFHDLGFVKPDRSTTADFLTSLTNPAERIVRKGFEGQAPRTPDEFAAVWKQSTGAKLLNEAICAFDSANPLHVLKEHHTDTKEKPKSYNEMLEYVTDITMTPCQKVVCC
jgi:ATP-binding cassette subfamily G (WHITE) protein 2 (PDR)